MKWRGGFEHCERRQQNRVEQMEQVEQIQDKARGCREEELGAKGVFQYVFQMFHSRDEAMFTGSIICC